MGKYNHFIPKNIVNCNSVTVELPTSWIQYSKPYSIKRIFYKHKFEEKSLPVLWMLNSPMSRDMWLTWVTSAVDCVCFLQEVTWAKAIRAAFRTAQSPISQRRLLQWLQSPRLLHAATAPALVRQLLRWWDTVLCRIQLLPVTHVLVDTWMLTVKGNSTLESPDC